MPRAARLKSVNAIYHIMSRSISEVSLFKDDDDKITYLNIVKDCQRLYSFKVYAYCLMDNHLHLAIDANGADISKIMHSINLKYVSYFNKKHIRHGHLFQDRFKSKLVYDNRYLLALTAYIHNNASDIPSYREHVENYYFSSLGVYLGLRNDTFNILDFKYVLSFFSDSLPTARKHYLNIVLKSNLILSVDDEEFNCEKTEYRSERIILQRNFNYNDIIEFISNITHINKLSIHNKSDKSLVHQRALVAFLLRNLCNSSCKEICRIIGNITQSSASRLCAIGKNLIYSDNRFNNIIDKFILSYS